MKEALPGREVIFEMIPFGAYMRVAAIDTATMTEVTIQGPASAPKDVLQSNAMKRLEYVLRKKGLIA